MTKTILITGSTDGIGFETAKALYAQGHRIVLHGRSATKLAATEAALRKLSNDGQTEACLADLSSMTDVVALGEALVANDEKIDVVINNAGVFHSADTFTDDGLDIRFAVNTFAPCLLTQRLLPLLQTGARRQPVFRGTVACRPRGIGGKGPDTGSIQRLCAKQAGSHHVVRHDGSSAPGSWPDLCRGKSRLTARNEDGEGGLWQGRERYPHRFGYPRPRGAWRRVRRCVREVLRQRQRRVRTTTSRCAGFSENCTGSRHHVRGTGRSGEPAGSDQLISLKQQPKYRISDPMRPLDPKRRLQMEC